MPNANDAQQPARLYMHRDGTLRATIMDDLDLDVVVDRDVVTINGPISGRVQFDLDDAADLALVLAEVAALRGLGTGGIGRSSARLRPPSSPRS